MRRVNVAVVSPLLAPTVRAMPWAPFLAAAGLGLVIVAVPAVMSVTLGPDDLAGLLRAVAVCGALGAAFALDDPAARTLETVPTPRPVRYAARLAALLPALAVWWAAVLAVTVAGAADAIGKGLPLGGLTLEASALAAVALAAAALRIRAQPESGGLTAGPAVLVLAVAATALPQRLELFASPGSPQWQGAHQRWAAVLAVGLAALAWTARQARLLRWHSPPASRL